MLEKVVTNILTVFVLAVVVSLFVFGVFYPKVIAVVILALFVGVIVASIYSNLYEALWDPVRITMAEWRHARVMKEADAIMRKAREGRPLNG